MNRQPSAAHADPAFVGWWCGVNPAQFAARIRHSDGLLQVMQSVCRQVVQSMRTVQAAGVTVRFRGASVTIAQTAGWVHKVTEHGCESDGVGPSLHAMQTRKVVTMSRPELLVRWPGLTELAQDCKIRAVHAEPLPTVDQLEAVLTLFSADFDVIDPPQDRLSPVCDLLISALSGYCAAHPHENHQLRLQRELHHQQLLGHAMAILMAKHEVGKDHALRMLAGYAGGNVSLVTSARAVVRHHSVGQSSAGTGSHTAAP